jgi:uncharacterized protein involved in copper resistance
MSHLRGKFARLVALIALLAGLIGTAVPGFAAAMPAEAHSAVTDSAMAHSAMDCDHATHHQAPVRHLPGADDCCVVNFCAMSLALPAAASGVALPAFAEMPGYDLPVERQPAGIVTAPLPRPPKAIA